MGIDWNWVQTHWLDTLQSLGIVAGLSFTGLSSFREHRSRRIQNLLSINSNHRQIWMQVFTHPQLFRVLSPKADVRRKPVTPTEGIFVNLIILHLTTVFAAMRSGLLKKPQGTDADLKEFFSLPIPRQVWQDTLKYRDKDTRRYVERLAGMKPSQGRKPIKRSKRKASRPKSPSPSRRRGKGTA
jgi:hypothetical protein